jgi:hypothetical protein
MQGCLEATCDSLSKLGGLGVTVWLFNPRVGSESVEYTLDADGWVTDITLPTGEGLYAFTSKRDSHSAGWEAVVNEGSTSFFQHNLTMKVHPSNPCEDATLKQLLGTTVGAIVETANQEFYVYGAFNGLGTTEAVQTWGNVASTDVSAQFTLAGQERNPPLRIFDTDYATTLAKILALVDCPDNSSCGRGGTSATSATATGSVSLVGSDGDTFTITVDEGAGAFTVAEYTQQAGDDTEAIIDGLVADVTEYTMTKDSATTFTLIAPSADGAGANLYVTDASSDGGGTITITGFSGGTDPS